VTIPESHLAQEAIAALVDGELAAGPAARAARHLTGCTQCRLAVAAQREAKEALHASADDVVVPGDLMSRLCAIPFTADVPGTGGGPGTLAAGPGELTVRGAAGAWSLDLRPQGRPARGDSVRWLRRGVAGTLVTLGAGVAALALTLPADGASGPATPTGGPAAGPSVPQQHTEVVPPVVRTLTVGTSAALSDPAPGGTP
jgi:anti-sigma factor RsiW